MTDFAESIRTALSARFGIDKAELTDDAELFSSGLVDSLGVMTLVEIVEKELGSPVPPTDIILENFDTIACISAYAERLRQAGDA